MSGWHTPHYCHAHHAQRWALWGVNAVVQKCRSYQRRTAGGGAGAADGGWRGGLWLVLLLLLVLVIIVLVIVLLGCGLGNDACMRTVGGMSHRVARTQSLGWACAVTDKRMSDSL